MATAARKLVNSRVLLIEHDRHVIDELRDTLAGDGFECEVALTVQTAEDILSERYMAGVVVNAKIDPAPAGGERGLIRRLKKLSPSTRIIIFNGVTNKIIQRRLRRLGADGYLSERSDMQAVKRSVQRVLGECS